MPGSSVKGKLTISKWFQQIPIKRTILDIGPGWATYSKLLRKKGQIWHAIEIHEPYVRRFELKKYYDKIFITDVIKFRPQIVYDLVIFGDILEHLKNNDCIRILKTIFKNSQWCIVSLPLDAETKVDTHNCHDYWQNEHEKHIGSWSNKEFMKIINDLGGEIIAMEKYQELGVYMIATNNKTPYTTEHVTKPYEWFLFHFSHSYENKENGLIRKYYKKIFNKLNKSIHHTD